MAHSIPRASTVEVQANSPKSEIRVAKPREKDGGENPVSSSRGMVGEKGSKRTAGPLTKKEQY